MSDEQQSNTQTPLDEKEEKKKKIRFPKSCKVVNADGDKIGKVRKSVYYDNQKEEQGKFFLDKTTGEVSLKKRPFGAQSTSDSAYTETVGYVDEHNDVLTPAGEYLATLKYRKWFLLLIFFLILCFIALILSMLFIDVTKDYIPTLFVTEVGGSEWTQDEPITVFKNGYYRDSVIFPGMEGEYSFRLENRNPDTLVYTLTFEDVNKYEIDMGYRLRRNGVCISGEGYVSAAELNPTEYTVDADQSDTFTLEWVWLHNDSTDTIAGMENATYTLNISFHAYIQNSH